MKRQTMITQIVTMTTAGMVNRKEISEDSAYLLQRVKESCSALMKVPPTDNEINIAFESGQPLKFSEILQKIICF